MKHIVFLFAKGQKFTLDLPKTLTRKSLLAQIEAFQLMCIAFNVDQRRYASGKTKLNIPIHLATWIGVLDSDTGKVTPMLDTNGNVARIKGYAILNKTGKGKDAVFTANAHFGSFLWSRLANVFGLSSNVNQVSVSVPELDKEFNDYQADLEAAKAKRLEAASVKALPEAANVAKEVYA